MAGNVNAVLRQLILSATHNRAVASFVRKNGMRLGASRFVAGETLDECVRVLRSLNEKGLYTNTTLLGEGVTSEEGARQVADAYVGILDRIAKERLRTNIALKLSHLGSNISEELAHDNMTRLLTHAASLGNFIRMDMEESRHVDYTLRMYRRLRDEGHENVGLVLQAYLHRSMDDLKSLLPLRPNLRIVKGAYLEPPSVAIQDRQEINRNYLRLAELALQEVGHTCIATHDERLINHVIEFTEKRGIGRDRFEFQMLYGVRHPLQLELAGKGYKVLVATPFGPEWYFYLMRRLAERPANVMLVARNLFSRGA